MAERNSKIVGFKDKFVNPRSRRVYDSAPPTPWGQFLHAWRRARNLIAKEAAGKLLVPFDTYRSWECGKHTPGQIVREEISRRMEAIQ